MSAATRRRRTVLVASATAALSVWLLGCDGTVENRAAAQVAADQQGAEGQAIVMDSVEVLRVALSTSVRRPDMVGTERVWEEAFMVRLRMNAPPAMGPVFRIFLGDERVSEYGGWEGGIYFWVYDPNRLDVIDGRTISYQFDRGPQVELGTLTIGDPRALRRVPQDSLRGR